MEIQEWMAQRKFLQGNLLYGIELERNIPKTDQDIYRAFKINPNYNKKWGYQRWHYQHDSSVHNGNEIILSGENFTYREMHKVLEDFEKAIDKMDAAPFDATTSNHITFTTAHKRRLDPIVVMNIWNIYRAFTAGLCYLNNGSRNRITRESGISNYAQQNLSLNPRGNTIRKLQELTGKYYMCSFRRQELFGDNTPIGLGVEFRLADGIRVPSALAALVFLNKAIILKATDEALSGLIEVEQLRGREGWIQNKELFSLCQSARPSSMTITALRAEAHKLLDYLEPTIKAEQDSDVIMKVLRQMADKSIGEQMAERNNNIWEIEKQLLAQQLRVPQLTKLQKDICIAIVAQRFDAETITKAKALMAQRFGVNERTIRYAFEGLERAHSKIGFDSATKKFIFLG